MRFLLIYPPSEFIFSEEKKLSFGISPPIGLLSIGRILKDNKIDVNVVDYTSEAYSEKKLHDYLEGVDFVGISVLSTNLNQVKELILKIKEFNKKITIIIGGPHCTLFPDKSLLETKADIVVVGDGEKSIEQLIQFFNNNISLNEVNGIFYKLNNKILSGKSIKIVSDLDSIKFPAWHLVDKYHYGRRINPKIQKNKYMSIVTSRGCPFSCKFCSRSSISMKKYRKRSNENILKEIIQLKSNGYKYIAFSDDCFLADINKSKDLFNKIINRNLDIIFYINAARVDSANEELYKIMWKAGVRLLQFGLESGNQDVLDFYNKQIKLTDIRKAITMSHDTGFFTVGTFILGAPFETMKNLKNTLKFSKSLPLNSVSYLPLMYMAGSELWFEAVKSDKILNNEYLVFSDSTRNLGNFTIDYLNDFCKRFQLEFYLRPKFIKDLMITCLKQNDFSFLKAFLPFIFNI